MIVDVTVLDVSLIPRQQDTQDVGVERDPPVAWMIDVSSHFPKGINRQKNVNKCRRCTSSFQVIGGFSPMQEKVTMFVTITFRKIK